MYKSKTFPSSSSFPTFLLSSIVFYHFEEREEEVKEWSAGLMFPQHPRSFSHGKLHSPTQLFAIRETQNPTIKAFELIKLCGSVDVLRF